MQDKFTFFTTFNQYNQDSLVVEPWAMDQEVPGSNPSGFWHDEAKFEFPAILLLLGFAAQISPGLDSFELYPAWVALSCIWERKANQAGKSNRVKTVRKS